MDNPPLVAILKRIRDWRYDEKQGYDVAIELLCEAEDELLAGEARAAALQRERDKYHRALKNHLCPYDMADWIACSGEHHRGEDWACTTCEAAGESSHFHAQLAKAEAAIVSLQAERDKALRRMSVHATNALQCEDDLLKLQAQLQAITQEMRKDPSDAADWAEQLEALLK